MWGDEERASLSEETAADENISFAAFVLAHVGCGDEVIELRLGERLLLEWCPACGRMEIFGPFGRAATAPDGPGNLA